MFFYLIFQWNNSLIDFVLLINSDTFIKVIFINKHYNDRLDNVSQIQNFYHFKNLLVNTLKRYFYYEIY